MAHLVMHRGETRTFTLEVNASDGTDTDLTNATLQFLALADLAAEPQVDVAATVTDAETGTAEVVVPAASTDDLTGDRNHTFFYVLRRTAGGNTDVVDSGVLIVRAIA